MTAHFVQNTIAPFIMVRVGCYNTGEPVEIILETLIPKAIALFYNLGVVFFCEMALFLVAMHDRIDDYIACTCAKLINMPTTKCRCFNSIIFEML